MQLNTISMFVCCAGLTPHALAGGPFTIADGNSSASFDTGSGQIDWLVDNTAQLFRQEFYFRRASDTREYRVDSANLNLDGFFLTDTNPFSDNRDDAFGQLYSDGAGLQIETLFTIRGGTANSGNSDIAEQITLRNLSNSSMTFSFFQLVDFDLGGDWWDDSGQIINGNTAQQADNDLSISETVVTPMPSSFQMDDASTLFNMLNDADIDSLNGNTSFSGDVGWAFQWNITLAAGDSFLISKDKSITTIPTPSTLLLFGAAGLVTTRRRKV